METVWLMENDYEVYIITLKYNNKYFSLIRHTKEVMVIDIEKKGRHETEKACLSKFKHLPNVYVRKVVRL